MSKVAFVFPGQGAQTVGMGKDFSLIPSCGALLDSASAVTGLDMAKLCLEGPEETLSQTQNTQPALLTAGAMAFCAFKEKSALKPDFVAGHSLGEFTAIYAAGGLSFQDAVGLVRKRGLYMSQADGGAMAAVLGMDAATIEAVCREVGGVFPANYNGDAQTVVAGGKEELERAIPVFQAKGAKRVVRLNVSAAFHSPFMKTAADRLSADLDATSFHPLTAGLVNNVDARVVASPTDVREGLKRQVTGAVRWTDVMRVLIENGVRTVIEFGPGKTLTGMFRRADKTLALHNVEDAPSLEKTLEAL